LRTVRRRTWRGCGMGALPRDPCLLARGALDRQAEGALQLMSEQAIVGSVEPIRTEAPPSKRRWLPFSRWHLLLFPLMIVMLFPVAWMLVTSIELPRDAHQFP